MATLGSTAVVVGGTTCSALLGDTWTFDGTSWMDLSMASGPPVVAGSMATLGSQIVLFGGASDGSNTWTFNGTIWTLVTVSSAPLAARSDASMAFLPLTCTRGRTAVWIVGDPATRAATRRFATDLAVPDGLEWFRT